MNLFHLPGQGKTADNLPGLEESVRPVHLTTMEGMQSFVHYTRTSNLIAVTSNRSSGYSGGARITGLRDLPASSSRQPPPSTHSDNDDDDDEDYDDDEASGEDQRESWFTGGERRWVRFFLLHTALKLKI